jgi:N-acetyltransferase
VGGRLSDCTNPTIDPTSPPKNSVPATTSSDLNPIPIEAPTKIPHRKTTAGAAGYPTHLATSAQPPSPPTNLLECGGLPPLLPNRAPPSPFTRQAGNTRAYPPPKHPPPTRLPPTHITASTKMARGTPSQSRYAAQTMSTTAPKLGEIIPRGTHMRLEPLGVSHVDALTAASAEAAAAGDIELYKWSPVPQSRDEVARYVDLALQNRAAGNAYPFTTIRASDNRVIGSTRFCFMDRWAWPAGNARHGNPFPDVVEIGYTWLARSAVRTVANTEAKLLMLTHAFETWNCVGVCLHSDARNARSRAAIERIGGQFDGLLRSHRMAADFIPRDSSRYSFIAAEWPHKKQRLLQMLA